MLQEVSLPVVTYNIILTEITVLSLTNKLVCIHIIVKVFHFHLSYTLLHNNIHAYAIHVNNT